MDEDEEICEVCGDQLTEAERSLITQICDDCWYDDNFNQSEFWNG